MGQIDTPIAQPDDITIDRDIPARRLLAHDLEPLQWEEDGEAELPPPD